MGSVLFTDGSWRIERNWDKSLVFHKCDTLNEETWWHVSNHVRCGYCKALIPDPIKGLWKLYNWER